MTNKSPMSDMALNKALSKWTTYNMPPREMSAFVDGFAAASDPLLARIEEFKTQEHHTLNVCGGVIEDLIRVSVSIGLSDEYTDADAIIAEIENLKAQVATARDDALEEMATLVENKLGRYAGRLLICQIRALKSSAMEGHCEALDTEDAA